MTQKIFFVLILAWHIQCQNANKQDFVKGEFVTHFKGPKTVGGIHENEFNLFAPSNPQVENTRVTYVSGTTIEMVVHVRNKPTTGFTMSVKFYCDNLALYCLRSYRTGRICARTIHYIYETFRNYCMMDYVNCCEFSEVWQIVHMGECFSYVPNEEYVPYSAHTDSFLDGYYWQDAIVDS